jgi:GT2 family glycosyltransferase
MKSDAKIIDISICIANYNGHEILEACLESIIVQETNAVYEIIVHDDASTDGSLEHILDHYPDVTTIRSERNVGYCVSNQGMGLDIFFTPFHCKEPGDKVVYAMGACLLIRKDVWRETGGYPAFFGYAAEDLYLCLKARHLGVSTRILSTSGYRHHISKSTNAGGISIHRRRMSERNRCYIIVRMLVHSERFITWPLFQLMFFAEMFLHAFQNRSLTILRPLALPEGESEQRVSIMPLLSLRATKLAFFFKRGLL